MHAAKGSSRQGCQPAQERGVSGGTACWRGGRETHRFNRGVCAQPELLGLHAGRALKAVGSIYAHTLVLSGPWHAAASSGRQVSGFRRFRCRASWRHPGVAIVQSFHRDSPAQPASAIDGAGLPQAAGQGVASGALVASTAASCSPGGEPPAAAHAGATAASLHLNCQPHFQPLPAVSISKRTGWAKLCRRIKQRQSLHQHKPPRGWATAGTQPGDSVHLTVPLRCPNQRLLRSCSPMACNCCRGAASRRSAAAPKSNCGRSVPCPATAASCCLPPTVPPAPPAPGTTRAAPCMAGAAMAAAAAPNCSSSAALLHEPASGSWQARRYASHPGTAAGWGCTSGGTGWHLAAAASRGRVMSCADCRARRTQPGTAGSATAAAAAACCCFAACAAAAPRPCTLKQQAVHANVSHQKQR